MIFLHKTIIHIVCIRNYFFPLRLLASSTLIRESINKAIRSKQLKAYGRILIFISILFPLCMHITVPLTSFKIKGQWREGMNVLGLVMFSVVLGATIGKMRERGKPIQEFLVSLSEAMMIITRWVIW